jgi:RNA polymerase sigma-70 factor (ECF subfamily)
MEDEVRRLLEARRYDAALERLLDLHERRVFRMALMMLGGDAGRAEEVTQDVFLKLWRALPGYDGRASPSTWLYAIARNTCLTAARAESYRRTSPLENAPEPRTWSAAPAAIAVRQCLDALSDIQRDVVTLFYLQERSVRDVAAMLDLPEGTVKSHLHRARLVLAGMGE